MIAITLVSLALGQAKRTVLYAKMEQVRLMDTASANMDINSSNRKMCV